jgi:hypothetical protein
VVVKMRRGRPQRLRDLPVAVFGVVRVGAVSLVLLLGLLVALGVSSPSQAGGAGRARDVLRGTQRVLVSVWSGRSARGLATARDDGRVNRRAVRALIVVLGAIGILFAGSGAASAEQAVQIQSRASAPDCIWFWWIDRWICRGVDDPPSPADVDAGDGDQPDGRRARASEAERGQRAGRTADPPPTRGTADR